MDDSQLPAPNFNTYVKESGITLWEGLPQLLLSGVLFTLVCVPAVTIGLLGFFVPAIGLGVLTIGPGWAALNAQVAHILLHDPAGIVSFIKAFWRYYRSGVILAAIAAVPLSAGAITLPALLNPPVPTLIWVGLAADLAGLAFLLALYLYAYPILVLYNAGIRVILRNSLILAARYLGNTTGLIAMGVLLVLVANWISNFLLVLFPACWLVFIINNCRMVLQYELNGSQSSP